jgi:hypothetical protein
VWCRPRRAQLDFAAATRTCRPVLWAPLSGRTCREAGYRFATLTAPPRPLGTCSDGYLK